MSASGPSAGRAAGSRNWDALAALIAALIGVLALLVSGYTAYIQRQQVRAQVWPYLAKAYVDPVATDRDDLHHEMAIYNKGVGPAIVRSVQVTVDGKSQPDWQHVFDALGLPYADVGHSTLNGDVLSPTETLPVLVFPDAQALARFREAMIARAKIRICYCSTLDECWMFAGRKPHAEPDVQPVANCPELAPGDTFND